MELRAYPYRIRKERLQRQWRLNELIHRNATRSLERRLQTTNNPFDRGRLLTDILLERACADLFVEPRI